MITIPEPCHEDFSRMLPTERGAFCSKCQVDTYDFKDKTDPEIAKILLENKGQHLCGQFTNDQLDRLNHNYKVWKNQNTKTFRSKFILALLVVFGLGLFSCDQQTESTVDQLQEISIEKVESNYLPPKITTAEEMEFDLKDYVNESIEELQEIACEVTYVTAGVMDEFEPHELNITSGDIAGGIGSRDIYIDTYLEQLADSVEENQDLLPEPIETNPDVFEATAYPNPTSGPVTVALEIESAGQFQIGVYTMNGQFITSVFSGSLEAGRQQFEVDLMDQETGIYLITVQSEQQLETLKVQRL